MINLMNCVNQDIGKNEFIYILLHVATSYPLKIITLKNNYSYKLRQKK